LKIVLAEKVSHATLAVFQQEPGWKIVTPDQIKNGLAAELADADALVVRSAVQADAKLLESAPRLRVIGRADLVGFGGTELGEDQLAENAALSSARLAGRIAENL